MACNQKNHNLYHFSLVRVRTQFKNQQAHDLIPTAHDLSLIGFKYGKYAVVFLHCVNLAKLKLYFPEFLFPYGYKFKLAQREIFVIFGRWKGSRSHYELARGFHGQ